ncbi:MAG: GrpB family protein [Opitutae bacterium]|nr:GrpB family protein [Opitutae bacterium]
MSSHPTSAIPRRERGRALCVALWTKAVELVVLAKVRLQGGSLGKMDRWALGAIHALMLRQLERMRSLADVEGQRRGDVRARSGVHNAAVILCASDPAWRTEADREAELLRETLGARAEVHHIGSTAIERLAAKPIVDLAATLPADRFAAAFGETKAKLHALGYGYLGVRGGHFFEKAVASIRTHALQVHPAGSQILVELLGFRDALRADGVLRVDYEATKVALAAFFPGRRLFYVFYKSHWIDDWQWRHSRVPDWADWFLDQKRAQTLLARAAQSQR